ncbi:MAG: UvrD-helicase domain-containing protein, partial [Candidatus Margulisiibacteriota bacterium]
MLLKSLNEKQAEAVQTTEGPLLIVAGAGSGKTRVLTHRIAYLIREKMVSPHNILAVTFTNKAAGEMRDRLKKLVGLSAREMWLGTFHSICGRILRRHIDVLGYGTNFVIYDEDDQLKIMGEILRAMDLPEKRFRPQVVLGLIGNAKNELVDDVEFGRSASDYFSENVAQAYRRYQEKLVEQNALDFDDMLMLTVKLFEVAPEVLAHYQERFRYISVDEYQDTNRAQYVLTNLLAEKHKNICVVGDSDQSIYRFRGADFRNIINFEKDYPKAKVILLEQNYRSTQSVLEVANHVIKNNLVRKHKNLWTRNPEGNLPVF